MKTKYLFFIFLAAGVFYLSSCQKELSYEIGTTQNFIDSTNLIDSNYLDKIFIRDSSGNTIDSSVLIFNYDAQKRLKNVISKGNLTAPDSTVFVNFFYNGTDTLPYRTTDGLATFDYYFYYDSNGKRIKDSTVEFGTTGNGSDFIKVDYYTYAGSAVYVKSYTNGYIAGSVTYSGNDTLSLDSRGNITSAKVYRLNIFSGGLDTSVINSSIFDNKLSPFTKASSFRVFIFSYNLSYEQSINMFTVNNLISNTVNYYQQSFSSGQVSNFSNSYTPNGYLKSSIEITDYTGNSTGHEYSNWNYLYKAL
jgi:hypothetical protein